MHIMTKDGWRAFAPPKYEPLKESYGYRGPLPSAQCLAFLAQLEEDIEDERSRGQVEA